MSTSNHRDVAGKAGRKEWIGLAVIALPCLLYSMDLTVLNLAAPHLAVAFQTSAAQLLWIADIYGFLLAGCLIPSGALGDRIGRRRLLMIGAAAFGCASALAAFAPSAPLLIAARALQGIAAATLAPSTLSLISNMFHDPAERRVAIGIWIASFSAGGVLGPVLGGLLLANFWWGSVFLLNLPLMALLLVLAPIFLPESRNPSAGKPDPVSALLSLVAVIGLIFGVKHAAAGGALVETTLAALLAAAAGALFLRRQRGLAEPFIDPNLFRSRQFNVALATNIAGFLLAFGSFFLIAQYLQLVIGLDPLSAGIWTAPSGAAFIIGSLTVPRLLGRVSAPRIIACGFALAASGFFLLANVRGDGDLGTVVAGYVILSLGLAPVFTLTTDIVVHSAPPERAGAASGIAETSTELGGALGIGIFGSVVTAVYRARLSPEASEGEGTRDTLAATLDAAAKLPSDDGAALMEVARISYASGMQVAMAVSAVLALVAAILVLRVLGGTKQQAQQIVQASAANCG